MALVQNKYSYPHSPLVGDLSFSMQNRILLEIANFLVNNGYTMVYSYYPTTIDTSSNRYTFHFKGNIYLEIYFTYSLTLNIDSGFGSLNANGRINGYVNNQRSFTIPTSGILELNFLSSNNCKILLINDNYMFSCFLFNKGWGNYTHGYNRFVLEIGGLYYECSKVPTESAFTMNDINGKHLLLSPIFTINKVPRATNNYKIDDELIYMGECYVYPASMGTLQEKIFYISNDGTKYFNAGLLKNILIVD